MTIDITASLKSIPYLKDAPRRALRAVGKESTWFSLPSGTALFEAGEKADSIYFVLSGAVGAFRKGGDNRTEFIGHIRTGEPVGEMSLFLAQDDNGDGIVDDRPHTSSVYALRDSEILKISRKGFDRLIKAEPEILEAMIRLILVRLRHSGQREKRSAPKVFTLVATSPTIDLTLRAEALQDSLSKMGLSACIISEDEGDNQPASYFDALERDHDIVMLISTIGDSSWYRLSMRQADRIWVVGRADARPSNPIMPQDHSPARAFKLVDVVLIHHSAERKAARPAEWLDAAGAARVFHWTMMDGDCCDRIARTMAGRSIGVVFSGGGARAYAHIGVLKAMREMNIPIDFAGGTSMGAVVAACVAMGWDIDEIDRRLRKAFVDTNPLGDHTLPVVGLVKGLRVKARLAEHFGDAEIGDLDLPYFAVSTNLTDGAFRVHRRGLLRDILRATIALPGILPPVVHEGEVLVDGGLLNNFPVDVMRDMHRGLIIGCDVGRAPQGLAADDFIDPPGFFRWVFRHGFRAAPPIAGLLMRAGTISTNPNDGRHLADVLVLPEINDIELRDWKAYDKAVQLGYDAAMKALKGSVFDAAAASGLSAHAAT